MKLRIEVPPSPCLGCGRINDMAGTVGNATPKPKDLTVCFYCAHLMVFADDLTLRNLTGAEMLDRHVLELRMRLAGRPYPSAED